MTYQNLTIGGTFDHFHEGHEAMLTKAFQVGDTVWLGITTDEFVKRIESKRLPFPNYLEPFATRKTVVETFLVQHKFSAQAKIVPITDRFGTTLTDQKLETIVVSPETEPVAREINQLRIEKGWKPLQIILVPWVLAQDKSPINSIRIRAGEISRTGELFSVAASWGRRNLPDVLRQKLQQPLGELFSLENYDEAGPAARQPQFRSKLSRSSFKYLKDYRDQTGGASTGAPRRASPATLLNFLAESVLAPSVQLTGLPVMVIAVGDAVTQSLIRAGFIPQVSVIDFHIARKKVFQILADFKFPTVAVTNTIENTAGTLSAKGFTTLKELITGAKYPAVLEVQGEEDLLTLFAILAAPLESLVIYGQPGEGIVAVSVTEAKKWEIKGYIDQFVV
ncbi:TPA: hypothetical protein DIV55_06895 [Patescibacteria group bacterium]|uniref:Phosphopantetheine adenylyltransferase n=1 Tax=Candidatus Gottesmanbacteria bacterium GW2011_GWA1_43_11 TaxID=1618436 RepID=A0A0G1CI77_9BACT|nr:MAG: Phosphopantetheine adenylyltransferase [Candidatus Gottesmanbacteria bacterium GW2011_GWA1_43_11]HCS79432.1 hypothetical protein [Patescibacteria group bacterium]